MKTKIFAGLKKTQVFLRSGKVTIFSIAAVSLLFLLGMIIPQKYFFKGPQEYYAWGAENPALFRVIEFFQFTDIYSSPLTLFFLGLFFLNLLLVFIHRVPIIIDRCRVNPDTGRGTLHVPPKSGTCNVPLHLATDASSPDAETRITTVLKKSGFRTISWEQENFHAVKNRFSPLGFLFFHASFFFCLLGGLMLFYTRFSGSAALAEGQTFYNRAEQYYKIQRFPKIARYASPLSFRLEKIIPESQGFTPTGLKVQLVFPGAQEQKIIDINKPLKVGDDTVVVKNVGVAPLFVVRVFNGREIERGYVYLNVFQGQEDTFSLSDKRFQMRARFYPDFFMRDGREATKSYELKNPVFSLVIDKEGQRVWEGRIGRGEQAEFSSFTLSFEDIIYWVDFQVVNERGDYLLFFGFILGAAGLILRFMFYRREVWGKLAMEEGQAVLYLGGQSTFFPRQFEEEMGEVARKIKESIQ